MLADDGNGIFASVHVNEAAVFTRYLGRETRTAEASDIALCRQPATPNRILSRIGEETRLVEDRSLLENLPQSFTEAASKRPRSSRSPFGRWWFSCSMNQSAIATTSLPARVESPRHSCSSIESVTRRIEPSRRAMLTPPE
jgi:hypothetical protein